MIEEWCDQVFFIPGENKQNSAGIILSCGIHGNETGPILVCRSLLQLIRDHKLTPAYSTLLIFGNPLAIVRQQRFVDFNLNRLFGNTQVTGIESERASRLKQACRRLQHHCTDIRWHLDLHSTIKPSRIERFALTPVTNQQYKFNWQPTLTRAGFNGLVWQTRRAHTFSQYTHDQLGADSFTLECGSIQGNQDNRPQQNMATDTELLSWLSKLVSDPQAPRQEAAYTAMQEFRVAEEIIRRSDQFRFCIDDQEPNFSAHKKGSEIYRDQGESFKLDEDRYSLFLNSHVAAGQRAGLLLERIQ